LVIGGSIAPQKNTHGVVEERPQHVVKSMFSFSSSVVDHKEVDIHISDDMALPSIGEGEPQDDDTPFERPAVLSFTSEGVARPIS
jgi:hypothetical protein